MQDVSSPSIGPAFPSGMTCEHSRQHRGNGASTSLLEDFPAKTLARLGFEPALLEKGRGYGGSLPESFAYFDRDSCWWKTFQGCLPQLNEGNSPPWDAFLESWPASGMTRNGKAYQLPPLVPRNSAIACSSSPTLRATEADSGCYQRDGGKKGKERATLLGVLTGWTPTLNAASGDKGPRKCATKALNGGHQVNLIDVPASLSGRGGGVLNPRWAEWYMGFPVGWCEVPSGG